MNKIILIGLFLSVITVELTSIQREKAAGNAEPKARQLNQGPATFESRNENGEWQVLQKVLQIRQAIHEANLQQDNKENQGDVEKQDEKESSNKFLATKFDNLEEALNAYRQTAPSLTTLPAEGCIPKKVCVSVRPKTRHPAEEVFPHSIDVERCGGCCVHPDLACLPESTELMTVKLIKYKHNPNGTMTHLGFTTTSVMREVKCKCVQAPSRPAIVVEFTDHQRHQSES